MVADHYLCGWQATKLQDRYDACKLHNDLYWEKHGAKAMGKATLIPAYSSFVLNTVQVESDAMWTHVGIEAM